MSKIEDLVQTLKANGKFCHNLIVPSFQGVHWCKIEFANRFDFLEHREEIESLIAAGLGFELNNGWNWEHVEFEEKSFKNSTPSYNYFVSSTTRKSIYPLIVSDTKDPLYDISLFALAEIYNKENENSCKFNNYSRTTYGFTVDFFTKVSAERFAKVNIFNRSYSWEKTSNRDHKTIYRYHLFMNDKKHLCICHELSSVVSTIKRITEVEVKNKTLQLTDEELFAKIQLGEMTLEEFKELKLK
jgi:hypothetical protein